MASETKTLPSGTAPIKPEYIISVLPAPAPEDDDSAEQGTANNRLNAGEGEDKDQDGQPPAKRQKIAKPKKARGANKGRKFGKVTDEVELCWKLAMGVQCEFGDKCKFTHDIAHYLAAKPRDIHFPPKSALSSSPPFVVAPPPPSPPRAALTDPAFPSLDFSTTCPVFEETGACRHGLKCRFLGGHARRCGGGDQGAAAAIESVRNEELAAERKESVTELNFPPAGMLKALRTKQYPTPATDEYTKFLQQRQGAGNVLSTEGDDEAAKRKRIIVVTEYDQSQEDTPDVPMRPVEKKRLHWQEKTYLAPLTTVGNLPFRRLCVSLGADITCGEMGLATSLLSGAKEEWSLLRRHPSERIFGVQLAGNKPATLVPAAEAIAREFGGTTPAGEGGGVNFVDLNCGCPIDLVFQNGAGAALLDQPGKLGKILVGMNRSLGEIPLTLKIRTGVKEGHNTAHRFMPRVGPQWGASAITIHGRTRQQRYTKLADWDYIKRCVETLRSAADDEDVTPIPIFGGGDCYSAAGYWDTVERTGVDGVMIARGALIKPWIFTEIKERREWDISARERLELIRAYAEHGLNHFGSDTAGVNATRRYLCEALSFQYRYIPIGLLERLPGRLNDRPPAYRGRDELETLLASGDSRTWVKISEMFLGPAPERFVFMPKHRSNAYGDAEAQG